MEPARNWKMPAEHSGNECVPPGELFTADSTLAALVLGGYRS